MPIRSALLPILAAGLTMCLVARDADARTPRAWFSPRDLGGEWTNASLTSLERPAEFDALTTTEAKAAEFEKRYSTAFLSSASDGVGGRQSDYWELGAGLARIKGQIRTSWIVDPADGRLPYTDTGRVLLATAAAARLKSFDGPEVRPASERCMIGGFGATSAPILNPPVNAHYQIVQTADAVALMAEINHDVRIIRLRGAKHPPSNVRLWMGDSIGHWEGHTLVVETTNFNPGESFKDVEPTPIYTSEGAIVTERFTRTSPTEILYQFEVSDPKIFTRTWRGEMVFQASKAPIYEYACHEGNHAVEDVLRGGRATEREKVR